MLRIPVRMHNVGGRRRSTVLPPGRLTVWISKAVIIAPEYPRPAVANVIRLSLVALTGPTGVVEPQWPDT